METKPLTPEKLAKLKDLLEELNITELNQSLVQDNKLIFMVDDKVYRCLMPSQVQQNEAETRQNQLKIKLIQSEDTVTRKRLIEILKEKQNIDIVELEKKKSEIQKDLQDLYLELAVIPTDNSEKIKTLKAKKEKIEEKFMEITIEITEMLTPCIEEQVKVMYYRYLAYACTEKQIEHKEEFESVWKSFEEFGNDPSILTYKSIQSIQTLILHMGG